MRVHAQLAAIYPALSSLLVAIAADRWADHTARSKGTPAVASGNLGTTSVDATRARAAVRSREPGK